MPLFTAPMETDGAAMAETQRAMNTLRMNESWLADPAKVEHVKTLRELAFGNCRILYGSERGKFFDIVVAEDHANKAWAAIVVCSQDGASKILRKEDANDPIMAVQMVVEGLHRDTASLLFNVDIGAQMMGQQGYTDSSTGTFQIGSERVKGAVDDTNTMCRFNNAPRGPALDRAPKRPRGDYYNGVASSSKHRGDALVEGRKLVKYDEEA